MGDAQTTSRSLVGPSHRQALCLQVDNHAKALKNTYSAQEQQCRERLVDHLIDSQHVGVKPVTVKRFVGTDNMSFELDAGAISDTCALLVEVKNRLDQDAVYQILSVADKIECAPASFFLYLLFVRA